ncbi:MAG: hydroxyacid dehydrogenase [Rhodobacteraceae bacterium]|jgi:D-3-phosphoglycerate dehydrogenase|uniref:D-3-phosphoglycerate dehydrogenase n=1 Tax=Salipiger profundus TaxID=1229727 RepID=A0A1U7D9N8_9RHOB|nr:MULTISPECIES: hydroxyacid dehydrogenase [Salipiger]APX24897.1 D-3-phosphoglycerate dehydrogenase [Salipiger profundus]MAB07810.1 hydroxyacid dehydrogenase [Paracoccaceae bacterium]GFZ98677.1 hydroxyacid dehydrogenase [Salipiger profundus]SFC95745.1 D-3-phosphoglycerate dehydrogenase [Salipiger profundus]
MSKTILVTGPDLDPAAVALATEHGFDLVHTPAYAESQVISEHLVKSGAVGIVSRMGRIDAEVMDAAPQLRVISKHGVGVDNIDLAAAASRGIPVLVATGANAVSVAEHAIALLLAAVKRVLPLDEGLRAGRWEKPGFAGRELAGATMGLMGMGAIARATGRMAQGLGLKLVGYDPFAPDSAFEELGATRCASVDELLAQSEVLSLHCPLTPDTREMLNAEAIAKMPKGAYVVNTARGGLIDEAALVDAVRSGQLAGAGLDTFASEPPAADHVFFDEPAIVLTPHIGGVTREAGARVGVEAVRGIIQIIEGQEVPQARIANRKLLADAPALENVEK